MDNETGILNKEEMSYDLYNQIHEDLDEMKVDWRSTVVGELFSFTTQQYFRLTDVLTPVLNLTKGMLGVVCLMILVGPFKLGISYD